MARVRVGNSRARKVLGQIRQGGATPLLRQRAGGLGSGLCRPLNLLLVFSSFMLMASCHAIMAPRPPPLGLEIPF